MFQREKVLNPKLISIHFIFLDLPLLLEQDPDRGLGQLPSLPLTIRGEPGRLQGAISGLRLISYLLSTQYGHKFYFCPMELIFTVVSNTYIRFSW